MSSSLRCQNTGSGFLISESLDHISKGLYTHYTTRYCTTPWLVGDARVTSPCPQVFQSLNWLTGPVIKIDMSNLHDWLWTSIAHLLWQKVKCACSSCGAQQSARVAYGVCSHNWSRDTELCSVCRPLYNWEKKHYPSDGISCLTSLCCGYIMLQSLPDVSLNYTLISAVWKYWHLVFRLCWRFLFHSPNVYK